MYKSPLLHFFLIGLVLYGLVALISETSDRNTLTITLTEAQLKGLRSQYGKRASNAELSASINHLVEQGILYQHGITLGFAQHDPVIINRLLTNMGYLSEDTKSNAIPNDLFEQALSLKMDIYDPVIRRRITQKTRNHLKELSLPTQKPTNQELVAHMQRHANQYTSRERWNFEQVYFDPARHTNTIEQLLKQAKIELDAKPNKIPTGDSSLLPAINKSTTKQKIIELFGTSFARAITTFQAQQWQGPIQSIHGWHFVKVIEHHPAKMHSLDQVYNRAFIGWIEEEKEASYKKQLNALRETYTVYIDDTKTVVANQFTDYWMKKWL